MIEVMLIVVAIVSIVWFVWRGEREADADSALMDAELDELVEDAAARTVVPAAREMDQLRQVRLADEKPWRPGRRT